MGGAWFTGHVIAMVTVVLCVLRELAIACVFLV